MAGSYPKRLSGRITLRVPPGVHSRLMEIADALGLSLVELLNLLIVEHLPQYAREADAKSGRGPATPNPSSRVNKQRVHGPVERLGSAVAKRLPGDPAAAKAGSKPNPKRKT